LKSAHSGTLPSPGSTNCHPKLVGCPTSVRTPSLAWKSGKRSGWFQTSSIGSKFGNQLFMPLGVATAGAPVAPT
jgi:hypothetical protein